MDKESFTLEELMNEDDIIQECKAANPRLVTYLGKRHVLEKLIQYLSEAPADDDNFKHSFTACEILCCELDDMLTALIHDEGLMEQLFSLLDRPPPLNSMLAGYFGRVVGSLLGKRPQDTHAYIESHRAILNKLVTHADTTSTVEVILRLIGADDLAAATSTENAAWLADTDFMNQLLDCLCRGPADSSRLERIQRAAQQNVGNVLVAVAHAQCSPMFEQLTARPYLGRMLARAAEDDSPVLQPVLLVCIALLDPKAPRMPIVPMGFGLVQSFEPQPDPEIIEARAAARSAAASEIVQFVEKFTGLLNAQEKGDGYRAAQAQPYGTLCPPLGRRRLTVVELGKALVGTREPGAIRAMLRSDFVARVMELFKRYPFNSILHQHVHDILSTLIACMSPKDAQAAGSPGGDVDMAGDDERGGGAAEWVQVASDIQDCLFNRVSMLDWLMNMSENADSDFFQARPERLHVPLRAAYHGHVLQLAAQLDMAEKAAVHAGDDGLLSALQLSGGWASYLEDVIRPRLEADKKESWQAPMPANESDVMDLHDEFPESGMDLADDYQNVMADYEPGAYPHGMHQSDMFPNNVRYNPSMFGPDDDEDDEDEQEADIVSEEPQSHSLDHEEDDESDDSDISDEAAAVVQPAAMSDLSDKLSEVELLDASTIEDEDDVILETGDDAEATAATTASPTPEAAAAPSGDDSAQRPARSADSSSATASGVASGEGSEGEANWWKIPEREVGDLPPPPPSAESGGHAVTPAAPAQVVAANGAVAREPEVTGIGS